MNWRTSILCTTAALMLLSGKAFADSDDVDVVGIRLGMTIEEAQGAIKAYNPDLLIQPPVKKVFKYRVGNKTLQTDPFTSYIFAVSGKKQKDDIYVYFSLPPSEPRAIAVTRLHNNFDPPMPRENYYKALVEKYGKPDATKMENEKITEASRTRRSYQWHIGDGKKQCFPNIPGGYEVEGAYGTAAGAGAVEKGEVLRRITTHPKTGHPLSPAVDPSDCAVVLTYHLGQDPLFSASAALIDVAGAAKSEQGMSAWIDKLAADANAKTKTSGSAPKL